MTIKGWDCSQIRHTPIKNYPNTVYSADVLGQSILPGINGTYDRVTCNVKMEKDIEEAVMAIPAGDEKPLLSHKSRFPLLTSL